MAEKTGSGHTCQQWFTLGRLWYTLREPMWWLNTHIKALLKFTTTTFNCRSPLVHKPQKWTRHIELYNNFSIGNTCLG